MSTQQPYKSMQRTITTLLRTAACLLLAAGLTVSAADVSGNYSWTQAGRNGGPDRKSTLKLKVEGEKVTGTMSAPAGGRRGGNADAADGKAPAAPADLEIKDAKIKGDELTFSIVREGRQGGPATTTKYTGKITGDTIKLKWERPGRDGGEPTPMEADAKKEAAK
ncbi:MAG: hypothetical protein H7X97_04385 [Opitutaceae bacterium]|nr:hypothetical protein [Verrucomicrobiales bacterium]